MKTFNKKMLLPVAVIFGLLMIAATIWGSRGNGYGAARVADDAESIGRRSGQLTVIVDNVQCPVDRSRPVK